MWKVGATKIEITSIFNELCKWIHICIQVRYDVMKLTWRHVTSYPDLAQKCADVNKNSASQVTQITFQREFSKTKKWVVNHFSTTFCSDTMPISDFVWFLRRQHESNDVALLEVIKIKFKGVLYFCQAVSKM